MKHRRYYLWMLLPLLAAFVILPRFHQAEAPAGITLATAEAREAWLNLRGWRVDTPTETAVWLPSSWDTNAGQCWLGIQNGAGLHPEIYAGQEARRYLYPISDKPDVYAELLMVGDTLIGAQIFDAATQLMRGV